ncbi:MAG: phosphoribosylformylglycinamidine synthase subunit PurQ [Planctomyces sp.]|nr:phosphoribosylformylglycinamidine synthase subunit PurQ [Planctomyces sp.]
MIKPRVCVLRAPGTNCDVETAFAFENCGADAERVHLFRLLEDPSLLDRFQVLCVPGGFSYGDDLGAGVVFGSQLRGRLGDAFGRFLTADKLALGICNGFQVLVKAGILPDGGEGWSGDATKPRDMTLTWNRNGTYTALWTRLRVCSPKCVFLRGIETMDAPIAHAEGRIAVRDPAILDRWRERGQVALCYVDSAGQQCADVLPWPDNPNGSFANIAGLCDATGRVFGLMPHPERFLFATQHPTWTRDGRQGEGDGMKIFRNAVEYFG